MSSASVPISAVPVVSGDTLYTFAPSITVSDASGTGAVLSATNPASTASRAWRRIMD